MHRMLTARNLRIGLGAFLIASTACLQQVEAREPRPYCFQGGRGTSGGLLDCSYHTWEQCRAMVTGGGEGCSINPELGWRARERAGSKAPWPRHPQIR
jgi:uncharacterized protein DUF3551